MQAYPAKARQYGVHALNRALEGVKGTTWGTTAVHICFGYAALVAGRPAGYSFLPELMECPVQQVSIETAQSGLDCSVLEKLPGKTIILGVLDLSTDEVESTGNGSRANTARPLPFVRPEKIIVAPDCGMKYLPRDVAFKEEDESNGGRRTDGPGGTRPYRLFRLASRLKPGAANRALHPGRATRRSFEIPQAGTARNLTEPSDRRNALMHSKIAASLGSFVFRFH